jgi:hypothetical protein
VLTLRAEIGLAEHHLTGFIRFDVPYLRMEPVLPSAESWWLTFAATLALFAASFLLPGRLIPSSIYLLRGILLVPATARLYFDLLPARFPHTPDSYARSRHGRNSFDLNRPLVIRVDLLHLRFRLVEEGLTHGHDHGSPGIIASPPSSSANSVFAKNRSVHARALHYLRHACKHSYHHRLVLVGHDLVLPISPEILMKVGRRSALALLQFMA